MNLQGYFTQNVFGLTFTLQKRKKSAYLPMVITLCRKVNPHLRISDRRGKRVKPHRTQLVLVPV